MKPITKIQAEVLASSTVLGGAKANKWWSRQARTLREKYADSINTSMRNGETLQEATARVIGGKVRGATVPGIMKAARKDAGTLVATSMNAVNNRARLETFRKNTDVIKAIQQISTLDGRTSETCIAYSDKVWDVITLEPIGHKLPYNGGPPRHFNCRSTIIAVTRSFEELGIDLKEVPPGTRASVDGQVAESTTMDDFLRKRTRAQQDAQLGVGKARLWREKKITLSQLVDFRGNPKTLADLEAEIEARKVRRPKKTLATAGAVSPSLADPNEPRSVNVWHTASWTNEPDYLNEARKASAPLNKLTKQKRDGAYFQVSLNGGKVDTRRINMPPTYRPEGLRSQAVWRHEYGHHLDFYYSGDSRKLKWHASITLQGNLVNDASKVLAGRQIELTKASNGRFVKKLAPVDHDDTFTKHLRKAMDDKRYLQRQFRKHGLSYKDMLEVHRKHMGGTLSDTVMRNKMAHMLTAIDKRDVSYYLKEVWEDGVYHDDGIASIIADYYGAMTGNLVGYGHSLSYYNKGKEFVTTEAFANAVSILGAEPEWKQVIQSFTATDFLEATETMLRNKGL